MFQPLGISPGTPLIVRLFISKHVEMLFRDVHAMLRLPIAGTDDGLSAGCNFAAATFLLTIIAGISKTLFHPPTVPNPRAEDRYRFTKLVEGFYPWDAEGLTDGEWFAEQLYQYFRNPLVHALGMDDKSKGGIFKTDGLSEQQLETLERATNQARWRHHTLSGFRSNGLMC